MLLIAQSETPGQKPLPSASQDAKLVYEKAHRKGFSDVSLMEGHEASKGAVMERLKDANCAHFACHGHQDRAGGLQSALLVHDGPILLSTIASNRLVNAEFAFLSACHTASGLGDLPDEAMHLAAGMQVAGFVVLSQLCGR
jgi:CHAT domain-containing protein